MFLTLSNRIAENRKKNEEEKKAKDEKNVFFNYIFTKCVDDAGANSIKELSVMKNPYIVKESYSTAGDDDEADVRSGRRTRKFIYRTGQRSVNFKLLLLIILV